MMRSHTHLDSCTIIINTTTTACDDEKKDDDEELEEQLLLRRERYCQALERISNGQWPGQARSRLRAGGRENRIPIYVSR